MKSSENQPEILLVTSKNDLAADLLVIEFNQIGSNFLRLNIEDFPVTICISWTPFSERTLQIKERSFSLRNIKSAWYRKNALPELPAELRSQETKEFVLRNIGAFLEGFWETSEWFWVNKPSKVQYAENKLLQLRIAKELSLSVPKTIITNNPASIREFVETHSAVIAKSISSPVIHLENSYWGLFTHAISPQDILEEASIQISPCIFQERINKKSDLRITVVGQQVFAAEIITKGYETDNPDWRSIDPQFLKYKIYSISPKLANLCAQFLEHLGLVYGAFDFVLDNNGELIFLEVNPSGQWGWIEHETGLPITRAIAELLSKGYSKI